MTHARRYAWIAIVVVDVGLALWGAMAWLLPDHLLGPGGGPILPAGFEGFGTASAGPNLRGSTPICDG